MAWRARAEQVQQDARAMRIGTDLLHLCTQLLQGTHHYLYTANSQARPLSVHPSGWYAHNTCPTHIQQGSPDKDGVVHGVKDSQQGEVAVFLLRRVDMAAHLQPTGHAALWYPRAYGTYLAYLLHKALE